MGSRAPVRFPRRAWTNDAVYACFSFTATDLKRRRGEFCFYVLLVFVGDGMRTNEWFENNLCLVDVGCSIDCGFKFWRRLLETLS